MVYYYMALSRKDWELPNSQIWLAEMDIEMAEMDMWQIIMHCELAFENVNGLEQ